MRNLQLAATKWYFIGSVRGQVVHINAMKAYRGADV